VKQENTKIYSLLRFSRAYCAEKLPWFAPALFQCRMHLTEKVAVAAIDKHLNVYWNPKAIEKIGEKETKEEVLAALGFVWIHEISHVLREHHERAKALNAHPFLWNVAGDLEINDSDWEGLTAPTAFPAIYPTTYNLPNGQLAEFYYQKMLKKYPIKKVNISLANGGVGLPKIMDEGSGVHGQVRIWEIGSSSAEKQEKTESENGDSSSEKQEKNELEVEIIRRAVAQEMKKANALNRGTIPGNWDRWVAEKLTPKVDWRKVLRHRMSVAINNGVGSRIDYSYRRPNRRQSVNSPFVLPSLGGDRSARITVIVDTSGSMTPQQLAQCVGEVLAVLTVFQIPVTVIPCDARAYEPIKIATPKDYFKLQKLKGGGGTNMIVGIEAALAQKIKPDSVLVLTDGYTPYPPKLYKTPVVFGVLTYANQQPALPPNPPWKGDKAVVIPLTND